MNKSWFCVFPLLIGFDVLQAKTVGDITSAINSNSNRLDFPGEVKLVRLEDENDESWAVFVLGCDSPLNSERIGELLRGFGDVPLILELNVSDSLDLTLYTMVLKRSFSGNGLVLLNGMDPLGPIWRYWNQCRIFRNWIYQIGMIHVFHCQLPFLNTFEIWKLSDWAATGLFPTTLLICRTCLALRYHTIKGLKRFPDSVAEVCKRFLYSIRL